MVRDFYRRAGATVDHAELYGERQTWRARRGSYHKGCQAMDFRVPGTRPRAVPEWARSLPEVGGHHVDWNGLIPGLQAGTFDLVSNGVGVTDERKKIIGFTSTYYDPYQIVMAVPANSTAPATQDAWNKPGITIVGQQASIAADAVAKSFPNATFKAFPDMNAAILEVASGRADGAVLESYGVVAYSEDHPDEVKPLVFPDDVLPTYYAAWAVQKDNTTLADYLSDWLCKKQQSGELAKIYEQEQHSPMPTMPACHLTNG